MLLFFNMSRICKSPPACPLSHYPGPSQHGYISRTIQGCNPLAWTRSIPPIGLSSYAILLVTPRNRRSIKNVAHFSVVLHNFDANGSVEFPAIAEASAPLIDTTMCGAGSAAGHTDPTRWELAHGSACQQACARSTPKHPRSWMATIHRASMLTPATTCRHHLPGGGGLPGSPLRAGRQPRRP